MEIELKSTLTSRFDPVFEDENRPVALALVGRLPFNWMRKRRGTRTRLLRLVCSMLHSLGPDRSLAGKSLDTFLTPQWARPEWLFGDDVEYPEPHSVPRCNPPIQSVGTRRFFSGRSVFFPFSSFLFFFRAHRLEGPVVVDFSCDALLLSTRLPDSNSPLPFDVK